MKGKAKDQDKICTYVYAVPVANIEAEQVSRKPL